MTPVQHPLGRVLMIQGTASHAGKSIVTAAFCRLFASVGYRVAPFKAQNMSNNAAVVPGCGEIGRAQAVQAMAAGVPASIDMNPVLLKPQSDHTSQVIVLGRPWRAAGAREYYGHQAALWPVVTGALDRLRAAHDVVVIEGAGSPAEINLAHYDLVNMRVARHAGAPVLLVGDIERGGVFASLYGTVALLTAEERSHVRGFVINKFRGDATLLTPGFETLRERTGIPTLGVLPFMDLSRVPDEDAVALDDAQVAAPDHVLDIAVLRLPRVANADEFQPLATEPGVRVRWVARPEELGSPDLVIVPGTKSTMADLAWIRDRGLDAAVRARRAGGAAVLGICGGYQMLGRRIQDPLRVESDIAEVAGLGLLPVTTTFHADKITERVTVTPAVTTGLWDAGELAGTTLDAYEIHMGRTSVDDGATTGPAPFVVHAAGRTTTDGASSADGLVVGTYLHGVLENAALRRALLARLAARRGAVLPEGTRAPAPRDVFDDLASVLRQHLDLDAVTRMMDLPPLKSTTR